MEETKTEEKLLTVLSMNGRSPAKLVGKLCGTTSQKAYRKIKTLEQKYGIDYIAELNLETLGYLKFLILVKFIKDQPESVSLKKSMEGEPNIQYGAILRGGDYDIMLYVLAENNTDISLICSRLRRNTILANYPAEWYVTPFYEHYGFMPIRDEFIDTLKGRIVNKNRPELNKNVKDKKKQILQREFAVLRELNNNGSADLLDIDKKYNFDTGRTQYAYYKLMESGLLKRVTISLQHLSIKYIAAIFVKVTDQKLYYETRDSLLKDIIYRSGTPIDRYALAGDITTPFGVMMLMPIFDEADLDNAVHVLGNAKGTTIKTAIITNNLLGKLCYRKFDNAYSEQAMNLERDFRIKTQPKIDYRERRSYYNVKTDVVVLDFTKNKENKVT